jgi:hypothetical protein
MAMATAEGASMKMVHLAHSHQWMVDSKHIQQTASWHAHVAEYITPDASNDVDCQQK